MIFSTHFMGRAVFSQHQRKRSNNSYETTLAFTEDEKDGPVFLSLLAGIYCQNRPLSSYLIKLTFWGRAKPQARRDPTASAQMHTAIADRQHRSHFLTFTTAISENAPWLTVERCGNARTTGRRIKNAQSTLNFSAECASSVHPWRGQFAVADECHQQTQLDSDFGQRTMTCPHNAHNTILCTYTCGLLRSVNACTLTLSETLTPI